MPLTIYATREDLNNWPLDVDPDKADSLLRSASIRVAWACNRNPYTDQPSGTDAEALRDATCAAVAAWLAVGIDPNAGGLDLQVVKATKLLTGSVDYETGGRLTAQQAAAAQIGEEARQLLLAAGLLWVPVPLGDPDPRLDHYGLSGPIGEGAPVGPYGLTWTEAQIVDAYDALPWT